MSTQAPERILRIKGVLERTGLTRSTLYRKIHEGTFPQQLKIAARCAGWRESAVNEWLNDPRRCTSKSRAKGSERRDAAAG